MSGLRVARRQVLDVETFTVSRSSTTYPDGYLFEGRHVLTRLLANRKGA